MSEEMRPRCKCGHPYDPHEHYRAGEDCSQCDCTRYRPVWNIQRVLLWFAIVSLMIAGILVLIYYNGELGQGAG